MKTYSHGEQVDTEEFQAAYKQWQDQGQDMENDYLDTSWLVVAVVLGGMFLAGGVVGFFVGMMW